MKRGGVMRTFSTSDRRLRLISWNLYYRRGAAAADVAALIARNNPDLFLMQEATRGIDHLPRLVGGRFVNLPWTGKSYHLAIWTPHENLKVEALDLPLSRVGGVFPQRAAQIVRVKGLSVANVHLSHGQWLNRRQLRTIAREVTGPLAIVGDFNALGPIILSGFADVGPRETTHFAQKVVPLRLDRCLVRGVDCLNAETLARGPSDHRPILIELMPSTSAATNQHSAVRRALSRLRLAGQSG